MLKQITEYAVDLFKTEGSIEVISFTKDALHTRPNIL